MQKESRSLELIRARIRHELQERDLSIQALADGSGLTRSWVSNALHGKVALSFADADAIAKFLGISLADMISEKIFA